MSRVGVVGRPPREGADAAQTAGPSPRGYPAQTAVVLDLSSTIPTPLGHLVSPPAVDDGGVGRWGGSGRSRFWTLVRAWPVSLAGPQVSRLRAQWPGQRAARWWWWGAGTGVSEPGPGLRAGSLGRDGLPERGVASGPGFDLGGPSGPGTGLQGPPRGRGRSPRAPIGPRVPAPPRPPLKSPPPPPPPAASPTPPAETASHSDCGAGLPALAPAPERAASARRTARPAARGARKPGGPPRCSPGRRRGTSRSQAAASSVSTTSAWPPASASTRPSWWPTPRTSTAPRPGRSRPRRWSPGPAWVSGAGGGWRVVFVSAERRAPSAQSSGPGRGDRGGLGVSARDPDRGSNAGRRRGAGPALFSSEGARGLG